MSCSGEWTDLSTQVVMTYIDVTRFCAFLVWRNVSATLVVGIISLPASFFPASTAQAESILDQRTKGITGRIVATRAGTVSTQVPGLVKTLKVRVGQRVERGDILAILDTSQLERDLEVARSEVEIARANLAVSKAEQALRKNIFDRQRYLLESAGFNKGKYDDANLSLQIAIANRSRASSEVASRQANLKRKELDIKLSTIRAAYSGIIRRISAQEGTFVTAEEPHILDMLDDTSLEIETDIPVVQFNAFQLGQEFSFHVNGQNLGQARVRAILPEVNRRTQTRPIRLTPLDGSSISKLGLGQDVMIFWQGP